MKSVSFPSHLWSRALPVYLYRCLLSSLQPKIPLHFDTRRSIFDDLTLVANPKRMKHSFSGTFSLITCINELRDHAFHDADAAQPGMQGVEAC